ncbi:MAG: beta-eliminating lyase-related protein [Rhodobacteraceae bacterium]|nr:beta-eliminating lyase-related protein [Paracoccaceae bacterium]
MFFASDNSSPAADEIMSALVAENVGYEKSYGADRAMRKVREHVRSIFEAPEAEVFLVLSGTAANALSLACLCPPWSAVFCHKGSHAQHDECGAPEFYTGGCKLVLVGGTHCKIDPEELQHAIETTGVLGVHNVQRGALTLTNVTEAGTCYTPDEMRRLTDIARTFGVRSHLDGARFANALVNQRCSPADLSWRSGIDVLSLGGAKNGLLGVEAAVLFDPSLAWEFQLRRKRGGHLASKNRFLSAQFGRYLEDGLWLDLAKRANSMAKRLAAGLEALSPGALLHPVEANMVFAQLSRSRHRRALAKGAEYYLWPTTQSLEGDSDELLSARLVCSWSTTQDDVDRLVDAMG